MADCPEDKFISLFITSNKMKRVTEKVRDIVEVCPFTHLHDFEADPGLTLAGYHFTDITADLMAKWIDRVAGVRAGEGAALALAGFRGVGKSHFLSVLAAIVSRPELRVRLTDAHVASAAERLSRRHGHVVSVRRGTGTSLLDELKRAIADLPGVNTQTLNDSLNGLLLGAATHAGELPLVILIDTALDRASRVARDDGILLSEIAEAARALGIFVGVALDDDISGADGANSSISGNFAIHFLDQEHLYKIVDSHIFSKHSKMRGVLHDIYENYRTALPGFRWSEQRFSSLYPLHPATLEIAPLIRLYIHDFALLGFASEAGVKILGRPANSLIGLDEVFDSVESRLRLVSELKETFAAFDKLEHGVIAKTPVQFRLRARLILKGLFMLSLDGQGSTAAEIAAAMMIFDEPGSGSTAVDLQDILNSFAKMLPGEIETANGEGPEAKYCLKPTSHNEITSVLDKSIKNVPDEAVWQILFRYAADKFSDIDIDSGAAPCDVEWRGAIRRGEVIWNIDQVANKDRRVEPLDWAVSVHAGTDTTTIDPDLRAGQSMAWRLAEMTSDEKDTVKRYHLLHNDADVRTQFGEGIATAAHLHSIAVEKIWQRIFLRDARIFLDDFHYEFAEDAASAHSLAQLFSRTLDPIFEFAFPAHPSFAHSLGIDESSSLIAGFFSGSDLTSGEMQKLAETFAVPLGLAIRQEDGYLPASCESLLKLEFVTAALREMDLAAEGTTPIDEISDRLRAAPFGLTREAQQLVLAALVAQREFEFVTENGNRINHRSLDLQIIWDDIVGLAKPADETYSPDRLILWAKIITGNTGIRSLDGTADRSLIIDSLSEWLNGWRSEVILNKFDALPDESLNAAIWKTAASLRKSFGPMADSLDALVKNEISLDQCLHAIAELFSDSETDYEKKQAGLHHLSQFVADAAECDEITSYLAACEITDDAEIEAIREDIFDLLASGRIERESQSDDKIESLWTSFKQTYSDHYLAKHDELMHSLASGQTLNALLGLDEWAAFEMVSVHPWFDQGYADRAKGLVREMRQLVCRVDPKEMLSSKPFCRCRFMLADFDRLIDLPNHLQYTLTQGVESFRARLLENGESLMDMIDEITTDDEAAAASIIRSLAEFTSSATPPRFTSREIHLLSIAADGTQGINFDDGEKTESDFTDNGWRPNALGAEMFVNAET